MTDKNENAPREEPASEVQANEHVKAFFLALAAQGKEAWNAWRRDPANADVHVTFADIDFSESPLDKIDFSGFEFGYFADFSGCKWRGVNWLDVMYARDAFHPGRASFAGATFGDLALFFGTTFGDWALFADATFGDGAAFRGATFGDDAEFNGAAFGLWADFKNTVFTGRAEFAGRSIDQWSQDLSQSSDRAAADDAKMKARRVLKKRHKESWANYGPGPDRFLGIYFSSASFHDTTIFSDRSFDQAANFADARFYSPPNLDGVTHAERIDLTGATIQFVPPSWPWWKPHWTEDTDVARRLRAFRKIAEETKNHDLERDLYIEERKAERGPKWAQLWGRTKSAASQLSKVSSEMLRPHRIARPAMLNWSDPARLALRRAWAERARRFLVATGQLANDGFWIVVMAAYWALADYGRSFTRPLLWLIASWAFFRWRYEDIFAPIKHQLQAAGHLKDAQLPQYNDAVHMVALGHAVPFVGAFTVDSDIKKFLFCGDAAHCTLIPPTGYQGLVITQNLISILLVFFIGLALRNYFRIK